MDALLSDLGDRYLVEAITTRGEELLAASPLLADATDADLAEKQLRMDEARKALKPQVQIEGLQSKLAALFDDSVWDFLHETCLGCGLCTYACPTCHCFDIVDEAEGGQGTRLRVWDSCQYPLFTHHASGHNPRPSGRERMRQRVMHKFHYLVENQGILGCVGCGRCIRNCPVGNDVRQVLNSIAER
jgi:ferredoxin